MQRQYEQTNEQAAAEWTGETFREVRDVARVAAKEELNFNRYTRTVVRAFGRKVAR